jgi:aspartate aminotransferase-like enzyme
MPFTPLLNPPAYPATGYAPLADRLKRLLGTANDLLFVQAEAILALEAVATSLARPGLKAINIVTSPYGGYFGEWLRRGGAEVTEIAGVDGQPITVAAVEAALAGTKVDLVAMVHAETSSGIVNPIAEIAQLVKAQDALLVVDAVASFGGHALDVDALGIDISVTGPQKAIGGPAGLSMVTVSGAAWRAIEQAQAPSPSNLSLLDIKRNWLDTGRGVVPGMPAALEFWALEAALDGVEAEGLDRRIARHALAARAARAGLTAMGVKPWVADAHDASALATAATVPQGLDADRLIAIAAGHGVPLTPGFGPVRGRLLRLDHTGQRAALTPVLASVVGLGMAIVALGGTADIGAGAAAVAAAYAEAERTA